MKRRAADRPSFHSGTFAKDTFLTPETGSVAGMPWARSGETSTAHSRTERLQAFKSANLGKELDLAD